VAGIGAGIAVHFGEQFSTILFPDVVKYLPLGAVVVSALFTERAEIGG